MVDPIKGCAAINLYDRSLLPTLQCTLQCMRHAQKCITGTQTFPISKLGVWKPTTAFHKSSKADRHQALKHLRLLDRVVSGSSFLAGCVFECNLSHRRSVAVLCMLFKIRRSPNAAVPCIHFVVHCVCLLCQCGLHVVPWSVIVIRMYLLAAEPLPALQFRL